jgi:diguanylate cyclase (GGDEF)-like protein
VIVAAALLVCVLLGLLYWLHGVYVEREHRHRHQAERELQSINQLQLRALSAWRQRALRDAGMLIEDELLAAALDQWRNGQSEPARVRVRERLRSLMELGQYTGVHYVDSDGAVRLSARDEVHEHGVVRVSENELPVLRGALTAAAPAMADPLSDPVFAFPFVSVFAPLYDELDRAIGAIWLVQDLRTGLIPLVEPWPTPSPTARSSIVWLEGGAARYLNAPRGVKADVLQYSQSLDARHTAVVQALSGMRGVFYAQDELGREVMAVASPVFGTSWMLVSAVEVAEVFADVRQRELLALALPVSALLLASAALMGYVLRRAWQRERVLTQALQRSLGKLEAELRVDPLTGVANRRALDEAARFHLALALRGKTALAVLMIDVDHFKPFNDRYGHPAGDQCLTSLAATFQTHVGRAGEMVARYGGEEFAVLLPFSDAVTALELAQRLCSAVRALQIPHAESPSSRWVTVSVGVAWLDPERLAVDEARAQRETQGAAADWPLLHALFEHADVALYEAKHLGRDRAVLYDDLAQGAARSGGFAHSTEIR